MFRNKLTGPFYTGISVLVYISEFNIRLCSPTSTSIHIEVAIKFSTEEGCILQFNNPTPKYGYTQYSYLRCFNVSWLSRYKEEDERFVWIVIYLFWCLLYFVYLYTDYSAVVSILFKYNLLHLDRLNKTLSNLYIVYIIWIQY